MRQGDCDVVDRDNDGTTATAGASFDGSSADDDNDDGDDTSSDTMSTTMLK